MRTSTILTTLVACVLLLALPAGTAWANAADDRIIDDCQNSPTGALRGSYPQQQLRHALHNLPGDVREYTGCSDAIRQALLASAIGGGNGGSAGGSDAGGRRHRRHRRRRRRRRAERPGATRRRPERAASRRAPTARSTWPARAVVPGALPELGRDAHRLPTPLLVLLVLLGVAALVPAALTIGRRVVGHRRA